MEQRISFITLAVDDPARSHAFYIDGLGWGAELFVPDEVLMIRVGPHVMLSLWDAAAFEAEVGPIIRGDGVPPITLAHNVAEPDQVDAILGLAQRLGADPVEPARTRKWGGYSGYFADPDGNTWSLQQLPPKST